MLSLGVRRGIGDHTPTQETLDGITVSFRFYLIAGGKWMFDLVAGDGSTVAAGMGLVSGVDFFDRFRYRDDIPPGKLFVFAGLPTKDPEADDFDNGTATLYYQTAAEVAELGVVP